MIEAQRTLLGPTHERQAPRGGKGSLPKYRHNACVPALGQWENILWTVT